MESKKEDITPQNEILECILQKAIKEITLKYFWNNILEVHAEYSFMVNKCVQGNYGYAFQ